MLPHLLAADGGYQAFTLGGAERGWLVFALATGVVAIATALYLMRGVLAADTGTDKMREIAGRHPGGRRRLPAPAVQDDRHHRRAAVRPRVLHRHQGRPPGRHRGPELRAVRLRPGDRLPLRRHLLRVHRLHRDEPLGPRQRPHGGRSPRGATCRRRSRSRSAPAASPACSASASGSSAPRRSSSSSRTAPRRCWSASDSAPR